MTVSRSQIELMHQLMMETYPSRGEENHQTAFLLCALSHGAAFLYSVFYQTDIACLVKEVSKIFQTFLFILGSCIAVSTVFHICPQREWFIWLGALLPRVFFFFLSWCNQETQTLKSASSGFRPCQGHLIVLEYLASHSTFSQLEIKDSNLYLSWLLCRLIKTCICLYTHISSSARHTVYIQT